MKLILMFFVKFLFFFGVPNKTQAEKFKTKPQNVNLNDFTNDENKADSLIDDSEASTSALLGTASYYADKFTGRKMANGIEYNPESFTAACNVLPLGTIIKVTNLKNNRSAIVKVTDRLHVRMNRIVDLSKAAAEKLGYISKGLTRVSVIQLGGS